MRKGRRKRNVNQTKLNPYSRSVSIIGVGCTPFMYTVDKEETNGLTEGELFGYAALKAMEDAGVNPQNVDLQLPDPQRPCHQLVRHEGQGQHPPQRSLLHRLLRH